MTRLPALVQGEDLSRAWARAFLSVTERGIKELAPLVVVTEGFDSGEPAETVIIQEALDTELRSRGMPEIHTVANTIFPARLWSLDRPRDRLFERYAQIAPRLRKYDGNHYGLYFERMIGADGSLNQLDHVINAYHRGVTRRTALQAVIFKPERDHTLQPRRGFPCLNQVAFSPLAQGGLEVTGSYTVQYLFGRAYGNFLGLARLGQFMAHEMGLELRRLVCTATVAKLDDDVTKSSVAKLATILRRMGVDGPH